MKLEVPQGVLEFGLADLLELVAGPQGKCRNPNDPAQVDGVARPAAPMMMIRTLKLSLLFRSARPS
jgi:hypothetical protein